MLFSLSLSPSLSGYLRPRAESLEPLPREAHIVCHLFPFLLPRERAGSLRDVRRLWERGRRRRTGEGRRRKRSFIVVAFVPSTTRSPRSPWRPNERWRSRRGRWREKKTTGRFPKHHGSGKILAASLVFLEAVQIGIKMTGRRYEEEKVRRSDDSLSIVGCKKYFSTSLVLFRQLCRLDQNYRKKMRRIRKNSFSSEIIGPAKCCLHAWCLLNCFADWKEDRQRVKEIYKTDGFLKHLGNTKILLFF